LTNVLVKPSLHGMETLSVYEAKTHLSRLLDAVEAGEEILITRNGRPVARLVRAVAEPRRRFGTMRGVATVAEDFDAPLAVEDLDPTLGRGAEEARGTEP
jgi:prevent-host-death family protein